MTRQYICACVVGVHVLSGFTSWPSGLKCLPHRPDDLSMIPVTRIKLNDKLTQSKLASVFHKYAMTHALIYSTYTCCKSKVKIKIDCLFQCSRTYK